MKKEDYIKLIIKIINENKSLEWLIDIYSFITNYPDNGKKEE